VAYPNGEGGLGLYRHWNAGLCCATGNIQERDDVGFVRRVIEDIAARFRVDASRVYLTGFSNGGMLAWRFAAEHPERVAGVAAVAATFAGAKRGEDWPELPAPARRVPLLLLYGLEDDRIPPAEVEASLEAWVSGRVCLAEPRARKIRERRVRLREWPGCNGAGPVAAWAIEGWGHRWPALRRTRELEDGLQGLDAVEILGQFFTHEARAATPRPCRCGDFVQQENRED
jgi:polyhydroxybutyrate depolymerase